MFIEIRVFPIDEKVIIKAYTQAIAADSVAVKMPEMTPPSMITAVNIPNKASLVMKSASLKEYDLPWIIAFNSHYIAHNHQCYP